MKNRSLIKTNDSDTVSSDLIGSLIDLQELSDLWKLFVYSRYVEFWNEESIKLKMKLEKEVIREGIRNKSLEHGSCQFNINNPNSLWQSDKPFGVILSDGITFVPISREFMQEVFEPIQQKIDQVHKKHRKIVANTIEGNEFTIIRIAEFIKTNGRIVDDKESKKIYITDIPPVYVFKINGINYAVDMVGFELTFNSCEASVTEHKLMAEKAEFNKALKCSFEELPLHIDSKYSTVQYIVKSRLKRGE